MKSARAPQLAWSLFVALYAVFLWRSPYTLRVFPLYVLDWVLPVTGLGAWIVIRWRHGEDWPRTALDLPLLVWLAVALLSTAFSLDPRSSLQATWKAFLGALILWLLVDTVRRGWEPVLWRVTYLLGGVVCIMGVIEFFAWYLGWPLLPAFQQGWPAIGGVSDLLPPTLHRLSFTLVHSTVLSAFLALLIPPAICVLISARSRDTRLGMLLWLIAAAGIEFLALSRGGILGLAVSLPVLCLGATQSPQFHRWWSGLPRGKVRAPLIGTGLVVLTGLAGIAFLLVTRLSQHASGDAVRWDLWRSALSMFRDHPLTGIGVGAFGYGLRLYREPLVARDHASTAHNLYLNTGAEMGVPGMLAVVWLLLTLTWTWWRRWRTASPGSASWWRVLGAGAALTGLAAQMLAETFVEPAVLIPATFFLAVILAPRPANKGSKTRNWRWMWPVALVLLMIGAAGLAWDTWGYARFLQSLTATRQNEIEQAIVASERARSHDPRMPLYSCHSGYLYGLQSARNHGESLTAALERYQECLAKTAVPGWLDQLNQAALLWEAGQRSQARIVVQETTTHTPLEWLPWLNRGLWAEEMGEREEAVSSYGWVLALDPQLAGSPFWWQGERAEWWPEILAAGEQALAHLGGGGASWRWQVLLAAGWYGDAVQEIEAWLEAHPEDVRAMAWLGEALLGLGDPREALVWLDRAIVSLPSSAQTYLVRGEAELALGHYAEAEHDLRTALFLAPSPAVHLGLARLAQQTGAAERALKEYSQALRLGSVTLGYPLVLYQRIGPSIPLPQLARIGYQQDEAAALEWGELLEEGGDTAAAEMVYETALSLDPFLETVRQRLEGLHRQ